MSDCTHTGTNRWRTARHLTLNDSRAMLSVTDLLGWGSSGILLATLMRQVYTQWRTGATAGLSNWLFIGQVAASTGYIVYSFLMRNWVYVSSNVAILLTGGPVCSSRNDHTTSLCRSSDR